MPYLECPQCRFTVSAGAYFLRDHCPRCRTLLQPKTTLHPRPVTVPLRADRRKPAQPTA